MSNHTNLAEALAAFQGNLPKVAKNKTAKITSERTGKSFQYRYADLAEVVEAAAPLMSEHGLSFSAKPTMSNNQFVLAYVLRHDSGEGDSGEFPLPDPTSVDIKQVGIAITYARRYVFTSVLGIVTDEDTDVQGAPSPRARDASPYDASGGAPRDVELATGEVRMIDRGQLIELKTLESKLGKGGKDETDEERHTRLAWYEWVIGRPVGGARELTQSEAEDVISELHKRVPPEDKS